MTTTPNPKHIHFKIEEFSRFERTAGAQRSSEPVLIQQLWWNILARREVDEQTGTHYLGLYVQCNAKDSRVSDWNCVADFILHVLPRKSKISPVQERYYDQKFVVGRNSLGTSQMVTMEQLLNTENGWYKEEQDNILLEAIIIPQPPYFQFHDWPLSTIPQKKSQIKTLVNRMKELLSTGREADVRFLVGIGLGQEGFSAHKLILTTVSDVFERMFQFDDNSGNGDKAIEVPDVTPDAFQILLNYIYTGETEDDDIDQDNAFDVFYAAKKYNVVELFNECLDCVKLRVDNVLSVLVQARLYELKDLINSCWTLIDKNASAVLATTDFLQIDQEFLVELFSRDQLKLTSYEIAIWNAALRWADAQCLKHGIEVTGDNRRNILGPALFNIRFPLISKELFAETIVPTKVLTNEEMFGVLLYHANPNNGASSEHPLHFSCKSRAF